MEIFIVVAVSENNAIGKDGEIPWKISDDLKRFKELTMGYPCIMGSKTYESIPDQFKPLPGRENIVLTRREDYAPEGVTIMHSFEDAIEYCEDKHAEKIAIIGGARVYEEGMKIADHIELTRIHKNFDGDAFFPEIDETEWELVAQEDKVDEKVGSYSYLTYRRRG